MNLSADHTYHVGPDDSHFSGSAQVSLHNHISDHEFY